MIPKVFLAVAILKAFALDFIESDRCVTPYQESANCVPLFSCAVITSALATLTPQALQFAKDSGCGCDMGMVCCGSSSNQSYLPLVNCSPSPQQETVTTNTITKETTTDLSKGKSCVTPYGEKATCKSLEKCAVVSSALFKNGDKGQRFFKDSQCGCDGEMVCCGTYNNKSYTPLIDCALPSQPEKILLSLVSDGSVCGLDSSTDRIQGGSVVTHEEHPWVAALEYQSKLTNENVGFRCGGSIITSKHILTAAHCIVDVEFIITKVWLGLTNTSSEEYCRNIHGKVRCVNTIQKMNVRKLIPHEFYNSNKFHDVGLILLQEDIEFTNYIRPICLPSSDSESPRIGTYLTVAGWGTTENRKPSEIKLKVEVPLQDNNICNEYLENYNQEIISQQMCVGGERGKDSCQGDSGGPLMYAFVDANHDVQWYQQGIVSYGTGCGIEGRPGIYTKLSSYDKWIFYKIYYSKTYLGKGDLCTAPNGATGRCDILSTCGAFSKAEFTKKKSESVFADRSFCGYDKHFGPLVCCENPAPINIPNWNSPAIPDKTTCGILKNKPRIDGTEIKDLAEFPWVGGIEIFRKFDNSTGIRCIGTVINSRYVLTSAECFIFGVFVPLNVWLGHWNTSAYNDCREVNNPVRCTNPVQKIKIKTTFKPPFSHYYNSPYDIALLLLENEIRFSDYISPICLPFPYLPTLEPGARMTVLIGTETYPIQSITSSDMMLKEEISLVSNDKCNMLLEAEGKWPLNSLQICAGGQGKHHCNRFHGSPLMRGVEDKPSGRTQWYLEGMVKFIPDECTNTLKGYPGSYNQVAGVLNWIINIISEN